MTALVQPPLNVRARALRVQLGRFTLEVPELAADASGTALLGPNGAGKTTLLLALGGFVRAQGDIRAPARTAAVFARPALLRGSASWNLAAVAAAALGISRAAAEDAARRALADVGLVDQAADDARTLSTGERQRLALARALIVEPELLLLDEPFANVDADAKPTLRTLVRHYVERSGCSVVLATASYADAAALCGEAVVLRGGRVRWSGPLATLRSVPDAYVAALIAEASAAG